MKKLTLLITVLFLTAFIVGCSSNNTDNSTTDKNKNDNVTDSKEEVTLKVASWRFGTEEDNNLERQMIQAFMEDYPHIKIEIDESIADPWNDSLATAASAGNLPDVFEIADIPVAIQNEWLYDLSEIVAGDADFDSISESVKDVLYHDDKVIALPSGQHFLGYYVNKDLYDRQNLDAPEYGMSIDEFSDAIRSVTDISNGVIGLNQPFSIIEWYPAAANDNMGIYTFNDGQVNLNSNEFIRGINFANSIVSNNYVWDEGLSDTQKANFNGENATEVWNQGNVGFFFDGSWSIGWMAEQSDFNWDFVGIPGGRTVVVNDFMGISKSTKHAEEAYLFTKYMTYGKEGFMKRLAVADANGEKINNLPISTDQEVLDEFFSRLDVPGILEAYNYIDNGVANLPKIVPGYIDARWNAPTGVQLNAEIPNASIGQLIDASVRGEVKIEDYISQLNDLANQKLQEGADALN
ncbi:ABC transporter substrate-binding protein [Bacillus sp. FJAT-45066]|uniref:ABC transporter substrate-binding protein n=1 Tax=Bacillus sp. FJAT-45066 TaxID=2011010 RepID=UPI000BB67B81|nr:extracellular solute-binding protein [Bacillus sp. FJAT-45066]